MIQGFEHCPSLSQLRHSHTLLTQLYVLCETARRQSSLRLPSSLDSTQRGWPCGVHSTLCNHCVLSCLFFCFLCLQCVFLAGWLIGFPPPLLSLLDSSICQILTFFSSFKKCIIVGVGDTHLLQHMYGGSEDSFTELLFSFYLFFWVLGNSIRKLSDLFLLVHFKNCPPLGPSHPGKHQSTPFASRTRLRSYFQRLWPFTAILKFLCRTQEPWERTCYLREIPGNHYFLIMPCRFSPQCWSTELFEMDVYVCYLHCLIK